MSQKFKPEGDLCDVVDFLGTFEGRVALLLKGSALLKGSGFEGFLKKSSEEVLNGSASLKGSPPKGSERV